MAYCRGCGAEVDGSVLACPECGERVWNRPVPTRNDPMAITSLVSGIAGLVACPLVGSIAALVTGAASMRRQRDHPHLGGRRLAVAGLVTGAVGMVWGLVFASIAWTWLQDREVQFGAAPLPAQLQEDAETRAQTQLRNALSAAKTIFTDNETYAEATPEALTLAEPTYVFSDDQPSNGPGEISVFVVSDFEIRMAVLSATGICYAIRDLTGPDGMGTTYARWGLTPCRASDMPAEAFGPQW